MADVPRDIFTQYQWLVTSIQWFLDGLMVVLLLAALALGYGVPFQKEYHLLSALAFVLTLLVFHAARPYRPWRWVDFWRLGQRVLLTWGIVTGLLLALGFVTKTTAYFSRGVLLPWIFLTPVVLVGMRLLVYKILGVLHSYGSNTRTAVIAGASALGQHLARSLIDLPWLGIRFLGFFSDQKTNLDGVPGDTPILGDLESMVTFVQAYQVNIVYLALPLQAEARIREIIERLQDTTASVYFAPDVFIYSLFQSSLTDLQGIPLISLWETPFFGVNALLKRLLDVILAGILLAAAAPLLVTLALGVKLTSPGPVFFKQRRYGLDGEEIKIFKFRTMSVCEDGAHIPQAKKDDPRLTSFGKFLRRTSLDELPQLFNVLQGGMSLVGPRPHAVAHNEFYRQRLPSYMLRHKVRPGITGLAQVNGFRGETETLEKMEQRLAYDLEYLRRWSLWLDVKLICQTVWKTFTGKNAY
uniref:Undecaprenyl-phosphate glucose phosphotransferase n=1 Tax=Desulfobacca acetoxidans TaxID=60893 RepID=A0A7V6A3V5_9BACT